MSDKIEFDLKEYLDAKFAEQTRLHESHVASVAAHLKSSESKVNGVERKVEVTHSGVEGQLETVDKRLRDLQWFIGILVTIIVIAIAVTAVLSVSHAHAQEVTSRNCCETQRTSS